MSDECTHLVIGRAASDDTEGESVEFRMGFKKNPDRETLEKLRDALIAQYAEVFDGTPARVGVAVLPYVVSLDEPESNEDDRNYQEDEDDFPPRYV